MEVQHCDHRGARLIMILVRPRSQGVTREREITLSARAWLTCSGSAFIESRIPGPGCFYDDDPRREMCTLEVSQEPSHCAAKELHVTGALEGPGVVAETVVDHPRDSDSRAHTIGCSRPAV